MPIGLGVILFTVIITAIYVRRANSEFDRLSDEVQQAMSAPAPGKKGGAQ
jgi:uncharacterized membrane protein (DUF485 family)